MYQRFPLQLHAQLLAVGRTARRCPATSGPGRRGGNRRREHQRADPLQRQHAEHRQRFWDGQDKTIKDDLTMIKGNHLIQFGGAYQRNFDYHSRTDNGQGINNQIVYQITSVEHQLRQFRLSRRACRLTSRATSILTTPTCWAWLLSRSWSIRAPDPTDSWARSAPPAFDQSVIPYLQRLRRRYLAPQAEPHSDLWHELQPGNAAL